MPAWDVCILHTLEDGMTVALPLRHALQQRGYRVLLSDSALESGASIREAVEHGLASCHYAVLVVSKAFLAQAWPQTELDDSVLSRVGGFLAVLGCSPACTVPVCHGAVWRRAGANRPGYSDSQGIQITDVARRNPRHLQWALARVTVLALTLAPPLCGREIAVDRPNERRPL